MSDNPMMDKEWALRFFEAAYSGLVSVAGRFDPRKTSPLVSKIIVGAADESRREHAARMRASLDLPDNDILVGEEK